MPKRMPNPHPAVPPGVHIPDHLNNHAKFELAQDRRLKRWDLLEGPEEKLDRFEWMRREKYQLYFEDVLKLTVHLVYADTHEEVSMLGTHKASSHPTSCLATTTSSSPPPPLTAATSSCRRRPSSTCRT